ncbi:tail fiber domain-containing protein, partial [Patescibacteria group bacterium]|nr:tail fiber domain-containing protein [Patescibacteria group bacterium]
IIIPNGNYYEAYSPGGYKMQIFGLNGSQMQVGGINGGITPLFLYENGSEAMTIKGGNVGIGTTNPTYRLQLPNVADATGQGQANAWQTYSSIRWKENITPVSGALDKISALNPVYFNWKPANGGTRGLGFIAEEVNGVVPEVVTMEADGVYAKGMDYAKLSTLAIAGVQELDTKSALAFASVEAQFASLGSGLRITNSSGSVIFSGTREISAQPSREIDLTASSIILDGNVGIGTTAPTAKLEIVGGDFKLTGGALIVDGVNLLEKTNENSQYIVGLVQNQNLITNQLTKQLLDESLSVDSKIQLIGESLESLAAQPIATINEKIADIDNQLLLLDTLQTQVDDIKGEYDVIMSFLNVTDGNFNLMDGTLESAGVVAGAFTVKTVDVERKTIGDAVICAAGKIFKAESCVDPLPEEEENASDGKTIEIQTKAVSNTAKIFTSFADNPGAYSWVEKIQDADGNYTGFRIKLSAPVAEKASVSWWIVEAK